MHRPLTTMENQVQLEMHSLSGISLTSSVFRGVSKARLEARRAKITSRNWRKSLKHKNLAPS